MKGLVSCFAPILILTASIAETAVPIVNIRRHAVAVFVRTLTWIITTAVAAESRRARAVKLASKGNVNALMAQLHLGQTQTVAAVEMHALAVKPASKGNVNALTAQLRLGQTQTVAAVGMYALVVKPVSRGNVNALLDLLIVLVTAPA